MLKERAVKLIFKFKNKNFTYFSRFPGYSFIKTNIILEKVSIHEFKDVINLYLDIRTELKNRCIASLAQDKQLNSQITDDLAVYFISYFIIKGISKYALRFLVANLDLFNKNPAKNDRDEQTEI